MAATTEIYEPALGLSKDAFRIERQQIAAGVLGNLAVGIDGQIKDIHRTLITLETQDYTREKHHRLGMGASSLVARALMRELEELEGEKIRALAASSEKLRRMSDWDRYCFSQQMRCYGLFLDVESVGREYRQRQYSSGGNDTLCDWLIEEASDETMMEFLRWNTGRVFDLQNSSEFGARCEVAVGRFVEGVKFGKTLGYIHPDVITILGEVASEPILISDYTDMEAEERDGYMYRNEPGIYVAESAARRGGERLSDTIGHEKTHMLGELEYTWADEAAVEHVTQSTNSRKWEIFDPHEHGDKGTYTGCRLLMHEVHMQGHEIIPSRLCIRALTSKDRKAKAEFKDGLTRAYGHSDVVGLLAQRMQPIVEKEQKKGHAYQVAVDTAASVIAREWTDPTRRQEIMLGEWK
jgi:hypothetical protein